MKSVILKAALGLSLLGNAVLLIWLGTVALSDARAVAAVEHGTMVDGVEAPGGASNEAAEEVPAREPDETEPRTQPVAANADAGAPTRPRVRSHAQEPEAAALLDAFFECEVEAGSLSGRMPEAGGVADLAAQDGVDAAALACIREAVEPGGFAERDHEAYFSIRRMASGAHEFAWTTTPPATANALDFPGVDPADVASSCSVRGDHECVVRAVAEIEEPGVGERARLFRSLAALERYDDLRAALEALEDDQLQLHSGAQALLWRVEHDREAGEIRGL